MGRYITLDAEKFVNKLLTKEEREVLNGLEINLFIDRDGKQIYHNVAECKKNSIERIQIEDEIVHRFIQMLCQDEEILALVGKQEVLVA